MTPEQIALVRGSFDKVVPIAATAADIFYNKLFELDPELKKLFKNSDMSEQGKKLMAALKMVVTSLDRLESILPAVKKMAVDHVGYGVKDEDYTTVGNALLFTLDKGLGDDFVPEVREAWVEAYTILSNVMKEAAAEASAT